MKWLNIVGLILQFLAFWFAAPELLGEQALKRFESGLIKLVAKVPTYLIALLAMGSGAAMSVYGIRSGMHAAETGQQNMFLTIGIILLVSVGLMVYFIFFARRTQRWLLQNFAEPLIYKLINNQESRKLALVSAAVIFTLGFLCQLIASVFA